MDKNPQTLTTAQLAERWHCSPGWLNNMRSQGRGPNYFKIGRSVLYGIEEILKYEAAATVEAVA